MHNASSARTHIARVSGSHPPLLSVVIVTRNEEAFIAQCIESVNVAVSKVSCCEVLLVDSRSDDRTIQIASRYDLRIVQLAQTQRCCPAMGRYVGSRLVTGEYILFVDGDSTVDSGWVNTALSVLAARTNVGGLAGREEQVYFRDGEIIGGKKDYFETGDTERVVDQLGGNAMYRRSALEAVGSFNAYLRSYEEAELGARLRRARWKLVRLPSPMACHHTPKPDSLQEYWRRLHSSLLTGQGQVLRLALRDGLFWDHARRLNRVLLFMAWAAVGGIAGGVALRATAWPAGIWLSSSIVLVLGFVGRSRSVAKPLRMLLDWGICSLPLLWGFVLPVRDVEEFDLEASIASDGLVPSAPPQAPPAGRTSGDSTVCPRITQCVHG